MAAAAAAAAAARARVDIRLTLLLLWSSCYKHFYRGRPEKKAFQLPGGWPGVNAGSECGGHARHSAAGLWVLFPAPAMAGHVVQHLAECQARAVVVVPDTRPYWFPMVQLATVRSVPVAPRNGEGVFQWPCSSGNLRGWRYPRRRMVAYELDFRHNRRDGQRGWQGSLAA